ncbi:MAG: hypothetical protein COT39_02930 [Parcubacteria group bacterium CG08_land_8_20_14_0_20_48_21]|nr:MAG: hypothetical protein COT39_02930 [Parcubacteria group bacterium CG08_land_8_20_14_0_20_48_21]PIW78803.1 MAG: hypothetical protein COZ99_04390 [Parcubacteria group bacterium CG_4_8_14_3_um_filter_48_16]PIY78352.1 MAG: hypothetical protein COY83_00385 [Parcubacteria group bacterium CG_4_10_14_0_8_um_filter_48_154]PIZ77515.1 MAG: hypothetical protein COY03_02655 [bacterium CG_4_10_14_0_2_um_filter_48_144]PJC39488.1 MAG: hypothetical protein CO043_04005 [Parcubacteria group bacterium CG_4_9
MCVAPMTRFLVTTLATADVVGGVVSCYAMNTMQEAQARKTFLHMVEGWGVAESMQSLYAHDKLPHFLLLTGVRGIGKCRLISEIIQRMFCEADESAAPCKHCAACGMIERGAHPNVRLVRGETQTGKISVDQARKLREWAQRTSTGLRVAFVPQGDELTLEAANALLKLLEEPPKDFRMFLVAEHPRTLPETLVSRAVHFTCAVPSVKVVKRFVSLFLQEDRLLRELATARKIGMLWEAFHRPEIHAEWRYLEETISRIMDEARVPEHWSLLQSLPYNADTLLLYELTLSRHIREKTYTKQMTHNAVLLGALRSSPPTSLATAHALTTLLAL